MLTMVTKEFEKDQMCIFYASDYHLEMILLPYIKQNLNKTKFVILSQEDLEKTVKVVLERINIDNKIKNEILNINWKEKDIDNIKLDNISSEDMTFVINGNEKYMKNVKDKIKKIFEKSKNKIKNIDCFNIKDIDESIEKIRKNYHCVLNTRDIRKIDI